MVGLLQDTGIGSVVHLSLLDPGCMAQHCFFDFSFVMQLSLLYLICVAHLSLLDLSCMAHLSLLDSIYGLGLIHEQEKFGIKLQFSKMGVHSGPGCEEPL